MGAPLSQLSFSPAKQGLPPWAPPFPNSAFHRQIVGGVPPWAPISKLDVHLQRGGAHGGTPLQVSLKMDYPALEGGGCCLGPIGDAELAEDVVDVALYSCLADV